MAKHQRIPASLTKSEGQSVIHFYDLDSRQVVHGFVEEMSFDDYNEWLEHAIQESEKEHEKLEHYQGPDTTEEEQGIK